VERRNGWLKILHNEEPGFIRDRSRLVKIISGKKAGTVTAQSQQAGDLQPRIDAFKSRKNHINREIEKGRQEVEAFSRREADIIKHLNQVDLALSERRKRAAALKTEIKKLEEMIDDASAATEKLKERIRSNQQYLSKRLVALYKMNWLGKFQLLASAESMNEFIQRKAALERILAHDESILRDLAKNQTDLKDMLERLNDHKARKSVHADEYQKQTSLMLQERATRTKLLATIRNQKELELAAIDALTQAAEELERQINLLDSKKNQTVPEQNDAQLSFSAHKGLLIMPVEGKITNLFGPYKNPKYNVTNFRSGIDIEADKGEPIRSVFKGTVIFSNWFKGYGNMIIVDHGNSYYTVYAHLEETFKAKGDEVDTAEVIATVGDTGSMAGVKLYFEVRHHGKPMNPLAWLKKG
jgi:septal ring factor EnvC (AmiA/AmiB activator)